MANSKKSPAEQKATLIEKLKDIKGQISNFDKQRTSKVGNLSKRFRLIDLPDSILEKEFKAISEKYKDQLRSLSVINNLKKNS